MLNMLSGIFLFNHVAHSINQVKHIFAMYVLYVVSFLLNVFSIIVKSLFFNVVLCRMRVTYIYVAYLCRIFVRNIFDAKFSLISR